MYVCIVYEHLANGKLMCVSVLKIERSRTYHILLGVAKNILKNYQNRNVTTCSSLFEKKQFFKIYRPKLSLKY